MTSTESITVVPTPVPERAQRPTPVPERAKRDEGRSVTGRKLGFPLAVVAQLLMMAGASPPPPFYPV